MFTSDYRRRIKGYLIDLLGIMDFTKVYFKKKKGNFWFGNMISSGSKNFVNFYERKKLFSTI